MLCQIAICREALLRCHCCRLAVIHLVEVQAVVMEEEVEEDLVAETGFLQGMPMDRMGNVSLGIDYLRMGNLSFAK